MATTSEPLDTVLRSNARIERPLKRLTGHLLTTAWNIYTLGLHHFYFNLLKYKVFNVELEGGQTTSSLNVVKNDIIREWKHTTKRIHRDWKMSQVGCALMAPLAITLLHNDPVFNFAPSRVTSAFAFALSVASLVLSSLLQINRHRLEGRETLWLEASQEQALNDLKSIEFWSLMVLPLSFLAYATFFTFCTVLITLWNLHNSSLPAGNAGNIVTAVLFSLLTLSFIFPFYRASLFLKKL